MALPARGCLVLLCLLAVTCSAAGLLEGLYCGRSNCYDVLEINRDADVAMIRKAYRRLAKQYHPDKYKGSDAQEKFRLIAAAYEVLKDEEERANYDFMLDNPEKVYRHYYRYYQRRVIVDVRVVIVGTLLLVSVIQYLGRWHSYSRAVHAAYYLPKYRNMAREIAQKRGLLDTVKRKKVPKEDVKAEEEAIIKSILAENLDVTGSYGKPSVTDVLVVKLVIWPMKLISYTTWYGWWVWRFKIRRQRYGVKERIYLTRLRLGLSEALWESLPEDNKEQLLKQEVWRESNYQEFAEKQERDMKVKMAESGRYKKYRRHQKKQEPCTFSIAE